MNNKKFVPKFTVTYGGYSILSCRNCPYLEERYGGDDPAYYCNHPLADLGWEEMEFFSNVDGEIWENCKLQDHDLT